ncbi:MAG TPA: hypothetical protein VE263_02830 [Candidatus Angelobacter sp.]|nr:hypothetical protein [Candidatus Angelobacter sp.]
MKKTLLLVLPLVIVFGAAIAFPRTRFYLIRADGGGGHLLWRHNEVYLFMVDRPFGYRLTGSQLLAEPINEYFYAPTIPENGAFGLTTIHITPSGVDHHVQRSTVGINSFTPIGDAIYAFCPGGICKWSGAQFEPITKEEEQEMGGPDALNNDWKEFTDPNGWSKRSIRAVGPGETPVYGQFSIDVSSGFKLSITEGNPTSVRLQRPNQAEETLWYYKHGLSVVSKAKYNHVFAPN